MNVFQEFPVLIPLVAGLIAEGAKLIGVLYKKSKIEFQDILQSGGLPSGHTVFVSSLATTVYLIEGVRSTSFAIVFVLAIVVMYDAMKIRRAAGRHAEELNRILGETKYVERLGHSPFEVIMGIVMGVGIAVILFSFSFSI